MLDTNKNPFFFFLKDPSLLRQFPEHHHGRPACIWESHCGCKSSSCSQSTERIWLLYWGLANGVIRRCCYPPVLPSDSEWGAPGRREWNGATGARIQIELKDTTNEGMFDRCGRPQWCIISSIHSHRPYGRELSYSLHLFGDSKGSRDLGVCRGPKLDQKYGARQDVDTSPWWS